MINFHKDIVDKEVRGSGSFNKDNIQISQTKREEKVLQMIKKVLSTEILMLKEFWNILLCQKIIIYTDH